jgi:hypothetical protein
MKGIRRSMRAAATQKAAALTDHIRAMVSATDAGMIGARDRALLLLGFTGAFRHSYSQQSRVMTGSSALRLISRGRVFHHCQSLFATDPGNGLKSSFFLGNSLHYALKHRNFPILGI